MPSPRINVVKCLLSGAIFCTVLVSRSPAAIGLSPTIAAPGSSTVITASSFIGTSQATFNGHQAVFQVDSATKITAIVPLAATTGLVEVTTPYQALRPTARASRSSRKRGMPYRTFPRLLTLTVHGALDGHPHSEALSRL